MRQSLGLSIFVFVFEIKTDVKILTFNKYLFKNSNFVHFKLD